MTNNNYKNWKINQDNDGIVWLHFDKENSPTNVLSKDVLHELRDIINELESKPPRGVVFLSDKESGFIAGADIKEFPEIKTEDQAREALNFGHSICNSIENLSCPIVALIHGFCLGGGMELALACRYRIADNDPKCKMGLPEVKLGIHPGFGGTVRMIRLIGVMNGLDDIFTGDRKSVV